MRRSTRCMSRVRATALAVAVVASVMLMGPTATAAANLETARDERELSEITLLGRVGLSEDVTPSSSPAVSEAPASSSSSSSSSSSHSGDEIVARMPIDAQVLAENEADSTSGMDSGSGDQAGSSSGSRGEYAGTVVFLKSLPSSGNSSSSGNGSVIGVGANDVEFFTSSSDSSSRSGSSSGSGRAQNDVDFQYSSSGSAGSSSSDIGGHDVGAPDGNATSSSSLSSSSSSSSSGSGSGPSAFNETVEIAAVTLKSTSKADKQDSHKDEPYSITITPLAKTEKAAVLEGTSALSANSAPGAESTDESASESESKPTTTDAPQMHGVPSNPTLVSAVAHDGHAEVTWKSPDDDGSDPITEYEVSWFDEEDNVLVGTQVVAQIASSLKNTAKNSSSPITTNSTDADSLPTSTVVSHLLNGKSYTFKVRAKNVNGFSVWSAKSLAVSPLHPPDLCGRISCSGRGTCFPNYHQERTSANAAATRASRLTKRSVKSAGIMDSNDDASSSLDAQCICRPGFHPPDCSVKDDKTKFVWKVSEWSSCSSGCGGGKRSREATCFDLTANKPASSEALCTDKKPSLTGICNGMECGSKLVSVKYEVEMSYDEVLFSPEAIAAFEVAFTTEVSAALQIPRTRLEITALKRGSIAVFFQILPASRVGEKSLNDIVEQLQDELDNATSTLRSKGTFARRVEPNGVKLSFSLADQTVQGGAEDISILGLIGTVLVLCFFVFMFGWSLRNRHQRILKQEEARDHPEQHVFEAKKSEMKRMGIRTMA